MAHFPTDPFSGNKIMNTREARRIFHYNIKHIKILIKSKLFEISFLPWTLFSLEAAKGPQIRI